MKKKRLLIALLVLCLETILFLFLSTCHFLPASVICLTVNEHNATGSNAGGSNHATVERAYFPVEGNIKTIQWYDSYRGGTGMYGRSDSVNFSVCAVKNCALLAPYIVQPGNPTRHMIDADAVLIHYIHAKSIVYPPIRKKGQVFVMCEREALQTQGDVHRTSILFEGVFNWTMTYRHDSDILLPYGRIFPKNDVPDKNFTNIFREKSNDIVWLVSHCETYSKREKYVAELQKYIDVDIYGRCGTFECPRTSNLETECIETIVRDYKFHLSFENTYDRDYVSEKFFSWFNLDIVQITMGAANYSNIAPRGSFINVADFPTPRHLAEYLNKLKNDEKRYTNMLKMKNKYYAEVERTMHKTAYCQLCEMLNNVDKYRKTYNHIHEWWKYGDKRDDATMYLKNASRMDTAHL